MLSTRPFRCIELASETVLVITAFVATFSNALLGEEIETQEKQFECENMYVDGNTACVRVPINNLSRLMSRRSLMRVLVAHVFASLY